MIYLDNGATTFPKPEVVYQAMDIFARTGAVNAGRGAYAAARAADQMIKNVRTGLISLMDAREQAQVVLTPSVTIALNQIIYGQAWTEKSIAYVSPYEHNSVLRPLNVLSKKIGFQVLELPLAEDLSIDLAKTAAMFEEKPPSFVAVTAVSNVTGYILPHREIFRLARRYGAFNLLDGSQAVGLIRLPFAQTMADAICFAGHKTLYGPFGIAGFLIKNSAKLQVTLAGGTGTKSEDLAMPTSLPGSMEAGSKDTVAIAGLEAALKWLPSIKPLEHERAMAAHFIEEAGKIDGVELYCAPGGLQNQAGVVSFGVRGFKAIEVAAILDNKYDIAVRAGHHCAALIHQHLGSNKYAGTVRVSPGYFNTMEDIEVLLIALRNLDRSQLEGVADDILRGAC